MPLCFKRDHCLLCWGVQPLPGWVMCSAWLSVTRRAPKGDVWHWLHRAFCFRRTFDVCCERLLSTVFLCLGRINLWCQKCDQGCRFQLNFWATRTVQIKRKVRKLDPLTEEQTLVSLQSIGHIDPSGHFELLWDVKLFTDIYSTVCTEN